MTPQLDVRPVCHGIAMQGELEAGLQRTNFQQCVQSEQATRDELKKQWSTFTTADKTDCVALAKTGGESSYTELITCMEMARDVRKLHEDQQKGSTSSAPVPEGLPAPVGQLLPAQTGGITKKSSRLGVPAGRGPKRVCQAAARVHSQNSCDFLNLPCKRL